MAARLKSHGADSAVAELAADDVDARAPGRRVAGQDPAKRQQIIEAAKRCFLRLGFEAASMNEITAEAGVSKGTLYVYFADKEALFSALCQGERARLMIFAQSELDASATIEEALNRFGVALTTRLTSEEVIKAQRMVLGVADRFPQLTANFFGPEPFSGLAILSNYLDRKVAMGELVIDDTMFAARQFLDLAMAGFFKRRLFGNMPEPPAPEEIARMVSKGVEMFLCYYRRRDR